MSRRIRDRPPLWRLNAPMYIVAMGWDRWGLEAQLRWLRKLRDTCRETADECDRMIAHHEQARQQPE